MRPDERYAEVVRASMAHRTPSPRETLGDGLLPQSRSVRCGPPRRARANVIRWSGPAGSVREPVRSASSLTRG